MKKIGLFYGTTTAKTASVAKKIQEAFGDISMDIIPVENASQKDFELYDYFIIGTSTWFDGELPVYWDEIIPALDGLKQENKKVAIFGLGDQVNYTDNFVDGIGILAEAFEACGATIVGLTSPEGYTFEKSRALRGGQLLGLAIDAENQHDKTKQRIIDWVKQLKEEFN